MTEAAPKKKTDVKKTFIFFVKRFLNGIKKAFKTIISSKKSIAGFSILMFFILVAIFGPIIFPYEELTDALNKFAPISWQHPLGTDELGRDLFRQLINGTRDVLTIAFFASLFAVTFGVILGIVSGLLGGVVDRIIQLITNLFLSIPSFPVMLMLAAFLQVEDSISFALILAIFNWAGLCRAIRAQVISIKEREFILICKVMNVSKPHIIFKEIIPNIASYILVNFIIIMKNATIGSVGIMMLGLASFDASNWGAVLNRAKAVILNPKATLLWLMPILLIVLFQAGALLLSNGLDETLNPRLKKN